MRRASDVIVLPSDESSSAKAIVPPPPLAHSNADWALFRDPLEERMRHHNVRGQSEIVLQDLNEIEVNPEDYRAGSLDALRDLHLAVPNSATECLALIEALLVLSSAVDTTVAQLAEPEAQLLKSQKILLTRTRTALLGILYNTKNRWVNEPHKFTLRYVDRVERLDIRVFVGILQCSFCLCADRATSARLWSYTPEHALFAELKKGNVISARLSGRVLMELTVPELQHAVKYLESVWVHVHPLPSLGFYLDVLVARLSQVVCLRQPEKMYGTLKEYRRQIDASQFQSTQLLLEDFCWTLVPMYKRLAIYRLVAGPSAQSTTLPGAITRAAGYVVEEFVAQNALTMLNKAVSGQFFKIYMRCFLRPSEPKRFARDHPNKDRAGATIIAKMRGQDIKNDLVSLLMRPPWVIVREKLMKRSERDLLLLLMLNSYINNTIGNLNWVQIFVVFNVHLLEAAELQPYISRNYPCIFQGFGRFGLLHEQRYYAHKRVTEAYLHWLMIMFAPPFNRQFEINTYRYDFTPLHTLLPDALRQELLSNKVPSH